jgi:hypothetical protein
MPAMRRSMLNAKESRGGRGGLEMAVVP